MPNTNYQGTVSSIAFGGEGIVKDDGKVIFIPFTAPGDQITYELLKEKKRFAFGKKLEILQPGPLRVVPQCPYFERCGGCQLQHLTYEAQADFKQEWVVDALKRIGNLTPETIHPIGKAPKEWGYRKHVTLSLSNESGQWKAGYKALDQSLLAIETCPIFLNDHREIILRLQYHLKNLDVDHQNEGRAVLMKTSGSFILSIHFNSMPKAIATFIKAMDQENCFQGIQVHTENEVIEQGNLHCEMKVGNLTIVFSPRAFIQNYPEQSLKIYQTVCELAENSLQILDLYCGIGISSLMLSQRGHQVIGIEANPLAIEYANKNKLINNLAASFYAADVKNSLKKYFGKAIDLMVINPPRIGVDPSVIQQILKILPKKILYISCMPSTLARDLKLLAPAYHFKSLQAFDMFPQTFHVESLAFLEKKK